MNFPSCLYRKKGVVYFTSLKIHRVKSVQIRSCLWSVFSRIRTKYGDLFRTQSKYGNIRSRKKSVFGHFSRSVLLKFQFEKPLQVKMQNKYLLPKLGYSCNSERRSLIFMQWTIKFWKGICDAMFSSLYYIYFWNVA